MITLDEVTYLTIELALFSAYTMRFGDIETETGYTRLDFKNIDNKYSNKTAYAIDESDLPIIIKALEWMLVVRDESELLDIAKEDGMTLLNLLKHGRKDIRAEAWFTSKAGRLVSKQYYGDTKEGNIFITTANGGSYIFPNNDPAGFIKKSSAKDLSIRKDKDAK